MLYEYLAYFLSIQHPFSTFGALSQFFSKLSYAFSTFGTLSQYLALFFNFYQSFSNFSSLSQLLANFLKILAHFQHKLFPSIFLFKKIIHFPEKNGSIFYAQQHPFDLVWLYFEIKFENFCMLKSYNTTSKLLLQFLKSRMFTSKPQLRNTSTPVMQNVQNCT